MRESFSDKVIKRHATMLYRLLQFLLFFPLFVSIKLPQGLPFIFYKDTLRYVPFLGWFKLL